MHRASKAANVKRNVLKVLMVRIARKHAVVPMMQHATQKQDNVSVQTDGRVIDVIVRAMQIHGEKIAKNSVIVSMTVHVIHKPDDVLVHLDGQEFIVILNANLVISAITVHSNVIVISIIQLLVMRSMADVDAKLLGLVS